MTEPTPAPKKPHVAPCGGKCILRPDKRHVYCTCNDADCPTCHHPLRFKYKEPRT